MMEHFQDLKLSVFVPFILEDFLDGHCLASLRYRRFEDNSEWAISNDLFSVIGEALLKNEMG